MSELRQREIIHRDRMHLAFVRAQGCCLPFCKRPAEAAHIRFSIAAIGKTSPGMQRKPCDSFTVPLCAYHHRTGIDSQHNSNESDWWKMRGINPFPIAASLWIASGGAERALQPTSAPRAKKVKPRKPTSQRKKVPRGRALQSRGFQRPEIPR